MKPPTTQSGLTEDELYTLALCLMNRLYDLLALRGEASADRVDQAIDELAEGPWHLLDPENIDATMTFGDVLGAVQGVLDRLFQLSSEADGREAIVSASWWMRGPLLTAS